MAIFPISINDMEKIGNLACDGSADVANLPEYARSNGLKPGSSCLCIDTGDLYMMKSTGQWKKM